MCIRDSYVPSLDDQPVVIGRTQREHEHAIWEKMGLVLSASERRADEASRDVEAWLKCWFVKERVGEDFSGTVTGVASFGIFVTLDTLHVEGLVHVSEPVSYTHLCRPLPLRQAAQGGREDL